MSLQPIITSLAPLAVSEMRKRSETYVELVFFAKDGEHWQRALAQHLGAPVKPSGTEPSDDDKAATKAFGGVQKAQTLFRGQCGGQPCLAMFWPWQDAKHVTLKLVWVKG